MFDQTPVREALKRTSSGVTQSISGRPVTRDRSSRDRRCRWWPPALSDEPETAVQACLRNSTEILPTPAIHATDSVRLISTSPLPMSS